MQTLKNGPKGRMGVVWSLYDTLYHPGAWGLYLLPGDCIQPYATLKIWVKPTFPRALSISVWSAQHPNAGQITQHFFACHEVLYLWALIF